jgi:GTPase SAR1 family protein
MENTDTVPATPARSLPKIKFRVLIIGRANAGKTSILQRVCDTTDSPIIYRNSDRQGDREQVRGLILSTLPIWSDFSQIQLEPTIDVSDTRTPLRSFLTLGLAWRAQHRG